MATFLQKIHFKLLKLRARKMGSVTVKGGDLPLVVSCVFKNEAPYLKEWIDFHLQRGVDRFYLQDNYSNDNFREVLRPYIESGVVKLSKTHFKGWSIIHQANAFNRALESIKADYGEDCWAAFIDIDEYLFSVDGRSVKEVLMDFVGKKAASVQLNWLMFGTSGLKKLDHSKPMIEQLTRRAPMEHDEHTVFKPIVYLTNTYRFFEGPHLPIHKGDSRFYFSDGSPFKADRKESRHSPLRLNHYWYRSEEDYLKEKKSKREVYGDFRKKELEEWHMKRCNEVEDREILKAKA